jgi:hypothetical protein
MISIKSNFQLLFLAIIFFGIFTGCNNTKTEAVTVETKVVPVKNVVYDTLAPRSMILAIGEACGGMDHLKSLKDVTYEYHYVAPDGKKEVSEERYIFDDETSWARYSVHEINVAPKLKGNIVHYFDGTTAAVYHNGKPVAEPNHVGTGQFLRQANYMWFTMMFKLSDPGVIATYQGQEEVNGKTYDLLHVTYDPAVTGKEENDIFILYINPETHRVESFKFSLPAFGVQEPVLHAQLTYEEIDGVMVITKRMMSGPAPDGSGMVPMVDQQLKNIRFNNGFTAEQLSKDIQ